jgi:hypothetical protein
MKTTDTIIVEFLSSIFIFLFSYTAFSKIVDFTNFQAVLATSPLIGQWNKSIALFIPTAELITAGLLVFGRTRAAGFISSFLLMLFFSLYVGYMLLFEPQLPCSCGGVIQSLSWQQHFWFNLFFTSLAAFSFLFLYRSPLKRIKILLVSRRSRKPVEKSRLF